jgi:hypothetical protein
MHTAIDRLRMTLTAVHRHVMATRGKARREFLGEGFKAAVARGNSASAYDGEAHKLAGYPRAARALASNRALGLGAGRLTGS